ncbi:MAG: hypothetical protein HOP33_19625 [Verrucomicrobia bacterium]|nr:hypothetical protein [Verrucomicrobiota bacterium]
MNPHPKTRTIRKHATFKCGMMRLCIFAAVMVHGLSASAEEKVSEIQADLHSTTISGYVDSNLVVGQPQPANDNFAGRFTIAESNVTISNTLAGATYESGEPFVPGVSSGQTAWWTWTAPSNGIVTLGVSGTGFAPLLTVYSGTELGNLSLLASNTFLACYTNIPDSNGVGGYGASECGCHWRVRNSTTLHVSRGHSYQIALDSAVHVDASYQPVPMAFTNANTGTIHYWQGWSPVQTTNIPVGGDVQLYVQFTAAPGNDDFGNAGILSGARLRSHASNLGATSEINEPDHLGNPGGSSVWFSWTAPASGRVTLSTNEIPPYAPPDWQSYGVIIWLSGNYYPTCGVEVDQDPPPPFFPIFAAYTGDVVGSLTAANNLPLLLDAFPHAVSFDAVEGENYHIAFDGNKGTTGDIPMFLALTRPASNDAFERRIRLRGVSVAATGYNAGATHQDGEPFVGQDGKTVWWTWTAPMSGPVSIRLDGSDYAFPVKVYTGSTLTTLQTIAAGDGQATFDAVEGETYQIGVGDSAGRTGHIRLNLQATRIEAQLLSVVRTRSNRALLQYAAVPGQRIVLLRSNNGTNWQPLASARARNNAVIFGVRRVPTDSGPFYRAIIFDRR